MKLVITTNQHVRNGKLRFSLPYLVPTTPGSQIFCECLLFSIHLAYIYIYICNMYMCWHDGLVQYDHENKQEPKSSLTRWWSVSNDPHHKV